VLYLGFPCTLIAISLYLKGLSAVTVSESAMLLLLQILADLFLASVLLGEFLSLSQTIGAVAIVSALVLGVKRASVTGPRRKKRELFLARELEFLIFLECEYFINDCG
jgi:drug/metabolite transporter (DMT)-like permease